MYTCTYIHTHTYNITAESRCTFLHRVRKVCTRATSFSRYQTHVDFQKLDLPKRWDKCAGTVEPLISNDQGLANDDSNLKGQNRGGLSGPPLPSQPMGCIKSVQ